MPIDDSVYARVQTPEAIDPVDTIGKVVALKSRILANQNEAQNYQITQQKIQATQAVRQALAASGGDYDKAADQVEQMGYGDVAGDLRETAARMRQNKWQERAANTQDYMRRGDLAARSLMGLENDPNASATYTNTVLPYIKQTAPEIAPQLPDHWGPDTAQTIKGVAMQWPEARAFYQAQLEDLRGRYGTTNPRQGLASQLASATSDDEWQSILSNAPTPLRSGFAPHFSPAAVQQAQQQSMGGYQYARLGQIEKMNEARQAHEQALTQVENWKLNHQGASQAAVYRALNAAETWYQNEMIKLEDQARGSNAANPLTDDQYAAKLQQIQNGYASMVRTATAAAGAEGVAEEPGAAHIVPTSQQPPDIHATDDAGQRKAVNYGKDVALPSGPVNRGAPAQVAPPTFNGQPIVIGKILTMKDGSQIRVTSVNPLKGEPVRP